MYKLCPGDQQPTVAQKNLAVFLQNFAVYLKDRQDDSKRKPSSNLSCDRGDNLNLDSASIYSKYRKNVNNRLKEINDNVSHIITDSCSRIDELCNKVRACLNDMSYCKEVVPLELPRKKSIKECYRNTYDVRGNCSSADEVSVHELEELKFENKSVTTFAYEPSTYSITEISESRKSLHELNSKVLQIAQRSSTVLTNFGSTILDEVYSTERMNSIIEAIQIDIDRLSETTSKVAPKRKPAKPPRKEDLKKKLSSTKPYIVPLPEDSGSKRYLEDKPSLECGIVASYFNKDLDIVPDVYRRPAITNIFEKLLIQLEANDSFICFQKLMHSCEKRRVKTAPSKEKKETRSKISVRRKSRSADKIKKVQVKPKEVVPDIPLSKTIFIESKSRTCSSRASSLRSVETLSTKKDLKKKYRDSLWFLSGRRKASKDRKCKKVHIGPDSVSGVDRYSLISLSTKTIITDDSEPLKNRKYIKKKSNSTTSFRKKARGVLNSKSTCFKKKHAPTLQVRNEIPFALSEKLRLRWLCFRNLTAPRRRLKCLDILDDLTAKDLHPLKSAYPRKDEVPKPTNYLFRLIEQGPESTWDQLLQPSITCCNKDCHVCNSQESQTDNAIQIKESGCIKEENIATDELRNKRHVVKKLRPYIFDTPYRHNQTYTVLPVQVYYDRQSNKNKDVVKLFPQKNAGPILSMKEPGSTVNKAKWTTPNSPKGEGVPEKPFPMPKLPPSSLKKQLLMKNKDEKKNHMTVTMAKKQVPRVLDIASTSFALSTSNKKDTFSKLHPKYEKHEDNPQKIKSIERKLEKEIEEKAKGGIYKNMSHLDRKMWSKRYGKSIGKQLIEFIGHQGPVYSPPVPKYALPKVVMKDSNTANIPKAKAGNKDTPTPLKSKHGMEMLSHLKELKEKNFNIQSNIEKAIKVIENKMADIIHHPDPEKNTNAFDVMEKEITNVLSLMKCDGNQKKSRSSTPRSREKSKNTVKTDPEPDLESISEELFRKLEKILDTQRSRGSSHSNTDLEEMKIQSADLTLNNVQEIPEKMSDIVETVPVKLNTNREELTQLEISTLSTTVSDCFDAHVVQESGDQNTEIHSKDTNDESIKDDEETKLQNHGDYTELCRKLDTLIQKGEECLRECTPTKEETPKADTPEVINEPSKPSQEKEQDVPSFTSSGTTEQTDEMDFQQELNTKTFLQENDDNANSFPEHLNKFIKRVEYIYKELDEIQSNSSEDNVDHIPTFKDIHQTVHVESKHFLTPFMQAVKDKRQTDSPHSSNPTKSPSYYNVLNFLDNLNDIQQEEAKEVHTARLCYSAIVLHIPQVFHQQKIEHTLNLELSRPSCLKKSSDECKFKPKKVSFSVVKEDKDIQADICPFHKIKQHKVSNHQFPPHTTDNKAVLETPDRSSEYYTTENCFDKTKDTNINENLDVCQMECQNPQENVSSKLENNSKACENSLTPDEASDSIYESSSMQFSTEEESQIQVFYDSATETVPKVVIKSKVCEGDYSPNTILQVKDSLHKGFNKKPKIVIFREISDATNMLKPLKNLEMLFGKSNLLKSKDKLIEVEKSTDKNKIVKKNEVNVLFLQSVYAAMYILIFAVLNMEHTIECMY